MILPIYAIGEKKPEKKSRASRGFEPVTSANTGAMLYQLSYKATHWSFFVGSTCIFSMKEKDERINDIILHGGEKQAIARSSP